MPQDRCVFSALTTKGSSDDELRPTPLCLIRWGPCSQPAGGTSAAGRGFKPSEADENWGSVCVADPWSQAGTKTLCRASLRFTVQPLQPLDAVLTPWSFPWSWWGWDGYGSYERPVLSDQGCGEIVVGPYRDSSSPWRGVEEDGGEQRQMWQDVLEGLMGKGSKAWHCACGGALDWNTSKGGEYDWEHRDRESRKGHRRWGTQPWRQQSEHQGERKYWNAIY